MKRLRLNFRLIVWTLAEVLPLFSVAQGGIIIEPGARVRSQSGSYWVVAHGPVALVNENPILANSFCNFRITASGSLALTAPTVLPVSGNWQNEGIFTAAGGSKVILNGTNPQIIGGDSVSRFSTLVLNNVEGASLSKSITVTDSLDLQAGILETGSNTVTVGANGTIAHAGEGKFVSGNLAQTFTAIGTKAYPVGKGGNYRPLTLRFSSLTGTSIVTASQTESPMTGSLPANTGLLTTGRYWTISCTGGSNHQYFITLDATGYTPSYPVVLLKKDAGSILSSAASSPNYTNYYALGSMGDFALGMNTCVPSFVPGIHTVADLQANGMPGAVFKWYPTASGGTALAASTVLENQHHYYASQTVNGVESPSRLDVAVTIDPTPCAPSAGSPQSVTAGSTVGSLTATGGDGATINWYTSTTGGVALPADLPLAAGTYYASQTLSCTESASRTAVVVTIQ